MPAHTIDEVISELDLIIQNAKDRQSPLGYFAALYRKVTLEVKKGIENEVFDDGPRMEKLDVIFANRYLEAYENFVSQKSITNSWNKAFGMEKKRWPIVLQHLLIGMNAHISLDLGIAAAEVSIGNDIQVLSNDFNRINEILAGLVNDVQDDLAQIWPTLTFLLNLTGSVDDWLINFSMKLARDGAWKFAIKLAASTSRDWEIIIYKRDQKVSKISKLVSKPGLLIRLIFALVRLGEKGTVANKILALQK